MYVLNWNPESRTLEANLGGKLTKAEAECFLEEFNTLLGSSPDPNFEVIVDIALVRNMDHNLMEVFSSARDMARFAGAHRVTLVAHDEQEMAVFTNARLQEVLEGCERYVAYRLSA